MNETVDVAVVGGGVSGLSAAYELRKRKRSVVVLERSERPGGIIRTERVGEFVIDTGPDALLVQKPAAVALCNELGLGDRLFPTKLPRTAFILRNGELHPLPGASMLGFPTRLKPLFRSTLFGPAAKLRMAAELFIPRRAQSDDESIAEFVRRRFGPEAVTYIAEPLLAGIHAGDVNRLSMRALFPRLVEAEARAGSVIKAFRRERGPLNADGAFRSFPNGLSELVDGLMRAAPKESVRLGSNVTRIDEADGFTIHLAGRPAIHARAVILAIPAFAAAELLGPLDADLAAACALIRYLSTRDGRLRVSTRRRPPRSPGHGLRRASGRGHQHYGRRLDFVQVAAARARRTRAASCISGWRTRSRRAVEIRHRVDERRTRRFDEDSRHPWGADRHAGLSLESIEPAAGSRARRHHAAHRSPARRPSRLVRLGGRLSRCRYPGLHCRCTQHGGCGRGVYS